MTNSKGGVMSEEIGLTRKQLVNITGVMPYTIAYLNDCGRLPVIRSSLGPGYPTIFHSDSVKIIKKYLEKRNS